MESYERSLSGKLSESQKRATLKEAEQRCRVLKGVFESTMLAARTNVKGMDKPLADYHDAMVSMLEYVKPQADQSMLSYMAFAQKTKKEIAEARLTMLKLSQIAK